MFIKRLWLLVVCLYITISAKGTVFENINSRCNSDFVDENA